MNPEYEQIARMEEMRRLPMVPPGMRSKLLGDLLGIQSEREQGVFPFSQTEQGRGRLDLLQRLAAIRNARALADSTQTMPSFENFIGGGGGPVR